MASECAACGSPAPFHLESVEFRDGTGDVIKLGDLRYCDQHMEGYLVLSGLSPEQAAGTVVACLTS